MREKFYFDHFFQLNHIVFYFINSYFLCRTGNLDDIMLLSRQIVFSVKPAICLYCREVYTALRCRSLENFGGEAKNQL